MTARYKVTGPLSLPAGVEKRPAVVAVAEEPVAVVEVPAILDPPGRVTEADGRVLSERLMFSYGYSGLTFAEMADELEASVLWLEVALRREPWLETARQVGVRAARRDLVILSERSLGKLVLGYELGQQKVTKDGDVVDYVEAVGPSGAAVSQVLGSLARETYGKEAAGGEIRVTVEVMEGVRKRVAEAADAEVVGG